MKKLPLIFAFLTCIFLYTFNFLSVSAKEFDSIYETFTGTYRGKEITLYGYTEFKPGNVRSDMVSGRITDPVNDPDYYSIIFVEEKTGTKYAIVGIKDMAPMYNMLNVAQLLLKPGEKRYYTIKGYEIVEKDPISHSYHVERWRAEKAIEFVSWTLAPDSYEKNNSEATSTSDVVIRKHSGVYMTDAGYVQSDTINFNDYLEKKVRLTHKKLTKYLPYSVYYVSAIEVLDATRQPDKNIENLQVIGTLIKDGLYHKLLVGNTKYSLTTGSTMFQFDSNVGKSVVINGYRDIRSPNHLYVQEIQLENATMQILSIKGTLSLQGNTFVVESDNGKYYIQTRPNENIEALKSLLGKKIDAEGTRYTDRPYDIYLYRFGGYLTEDMISSNDFQTKKISGNLSLESSNFIIINGSEKYYLKTQRIGFNEKLKIFVGEKMDVEGLIYPDKPYEIEVKIFGRSALEILPSSSIKTTESKVQPGTSLPASSSKAATTPVKENINISGKLSFTKGIYTLQQGKTKYTLKGNEASLKKYIGKNISIKGYRFSNNKLVINVVSIVKL